MDGGERGLQPGVPIGACSNGDLLLVARVRGVVGGDAVDVPERSPVDQRLAVGLRAQRRVHLHVRIERAHRLVGEAQVVRRGLGCHPTPISFAWRPPRPTRCSSGAACGPGRPRSRRRGVAGDHRRLADDGMPVDAEQRADRALVHRAVAAERRVLLVQRDDAAGRAAGTAAPCAASRRETTGLPSSVKPDAPSARSSAISVSSLPLRPR